MQYDNCVMMGQQIVSRGEYRMLPEVLQTGEQPKCIITGRYNNRNGMLVATDRRLVFLDKQFFGAMETETILYNALSAVEWSTGVMMGSITLHAHGKANKVTKVDKAYVRYFANYLETKLMGGDAEAVLRQIHSDNPQLQQKSKWSDNIGGVIVLALALALVAGCVKCVL